MHLQNKNLKNWLDRIHIVLLVGIFAIFVARLFSLETLKEVEEYASTSGKIAAVLFPLTLIPGSMRRFGFLKPVYGTWIYYLRQIGITMYVVAFFHLVTHMSQIPLFNPILKFYPPVLLSGLVSFLLLLPVYLSSNNWSMKVLKRKWKPIQRTTYLVFFVILLHFILIPSNDLVVIYVIVGLFVMASWVYRFLKK